MGDITPLTGLGKAGSSSIASVHVIKDKVQKRKRPSEENKQVVSFVSTSKIPRKTVSGRSNSAISTVSTEGFVSIDGAAMLENALEEIGALRIREAFLRRLDAIPGPKVTLTNDIDDTSPSLSFRFVDSCVLREGVTKASEEFMFGCTCKPNNGRHMGCEYTACECLDQMNNRKFPYIATGDRAGTLRDGHLSTRDAIFECNRLCNCGDNCLRCPVDLRKGEFIDTYKGEIITNRAANERERAKKKIKAKDTYLYTMEKFAEGNNIPPHMLYIVDGEYLGGPTRFMNHSCDPNCRQFSVSYHHGDMYIYDLAFFAIDSIPAGTELTFNYTDNDHTEQRRKKKSRDSLECLCGSANCRGYIWM
ncbi:hypothetical protein GP486_004633 [Trichoglossum hirsutum]|uniref:Histone-lysine N-methyltransferase n=1 Tax=Trichoglossum hirsutum TaxID=265104 RepID=A0A9P8RNQ8_9PEZI|nr:hypothetical protein GP486_004633 [Trichoglossum hirsutum]